MNMFELVESLSDSEVNLIISELRNYEETGYLLDDDLTRELILKYLQYNPTNNFFYSLLEFQMAFYRRFTKKYFDKINEQ